ncbi:MAG: hypothetical protein JWM04_1052, partial [Verrucomicrobiales bacterium]|nr:hypothetical protein [Verrucomicrobiales bacterium]
MINYRHQVPKHFFQTPWKILILLGFCSILTACHTKIKEPVLGPGYKLNNVFAVSGTLPPELRRVAVLPIHIRTINFNNEDGKDNLTPILLKELQKSGRFEIIPIS